MEFKKSRLKVTRCKECGEESKASLCNHCFVDFLAEAIDRGETDLSKVLIQLAQKYGRVRYLDHLDSYKEVQRRLLSGAPLQSLRPTEIVVTSTSTGLQYPSTGIRPVASSFRHSRTFGPGISGIERRETETLIEEAKTDQLYKAFKKLAEES